jgi:hypothetical protein
MDLNNNLAGNISIRTLAAGDINLFTQNGYNVNLTQNSALTLNGGNDDFYIKYNGNDYMIIHGNNVEVQGQFTSVAIGGSSDIRLKDNIVPLEDAYERLLKLNGYTFTWKDHPERGTNIGFIAQEIEELFPELITPDSRGFLTVQYGNMTAILVEALKTQRDMMRDMRNDYNQKISLILNAFQSQNAALNDLRERLTQVESDRE